jgi:hypothetical protein
MISKNNMKQLTLRLSDEENEALNSLKLDLGYTSTTKLLRDLIMKKKIKPRLNADINALTGLGTGLIYKMRSLTNLLGAEIPEDFQQKFDKWLKEYEEIIDKYAVYEG